MHKVLIADDHPLFREALRSALGLVFSDGPCQIWEAGSVAAARQILGEVEDVDLVLLDLKMPGMDGFGGLIDLRQEFPAVPIVIVSASDQVSVIRSAMAHGASGFIPKSLERASMADALRVVLDGGTWVPPEAMLDDAGGQNAAEVTRVGDVIRRIGMLTSQQRKVLQLIAQGKPNKVIAHELDIAETTVKAHITIVLRKLGVSSRTQAVLMVRDTYSEPA